jgi:hypothetical protein
MEVGRGGGGCEKPRKEKKEGRREGGRERMRVKRCLPRGILLHAFRDVHTEGSEPRQSGGNALRKALRDGGEQGGEEDGREGGKEVKVWQEGGHAPSRERERRGKGRRGDQGVGSRSSRSQEGGDAPLEGGTR